MKAKRTGGLRNPALPVMIYGRVLRIEAQKIEEHTCDPGCANVKHCFYHPFTPGAAIYGTRAGWMKVGDGDLLITTRKIDYV